MDKAINEILKKYVDIFNTEYQLLLNNDQKELLSNINYDYAIEFNDNVLPFGVVAFNHIYISHVDKMIESMKLIPTYATSNKHLNNKNYSTYLEYMCMCGYNSINYYADHLMYLVFKMVIHNHSSLIYGLINQEIKDLSHKYHINMVNLYSHESLIANKFIEVMGKEISHKIIFMDRSSAFKYINDVKGLRYAKYFNDLMELMDDKFQSVYNHQYSGNNRLIDYAIDYDKIKYGNIYNYILDFSIDNNLIK